MASHQWLAVGIGLIASGCSFANPPNVLNDEGKQVLVVERRIELRDCLPLSTVQGKGSTVFRQNLAEDIEIDGRNKAGHQGANRIIVKPNHELIRNADLIGIIYEAFYCPAAGPPSQPPAPSQPDQPKQG